MITAKTHPIKEARLRRQLTQQEVANEIGVSKGAVSRWESSTDEPAPRKAIALTKLLPGLKIEQIYPEARASHAEQASDSRHDRAAA